jgi:hypothetical protein
MHQESLSAPHMHSCRELVSLTLSHELLVAFLGSCWRSERTRYPCFDGDIAFARLVENKLDGRMTNILKIISTPNNKTLVQILIGAWLQLHCVEGKMLSLTRHEPSHLGERYSRQASRLKVEKESFTCINQ